LSPDEDLDADRMVELRAMANMLRRAEGFTLAFAQCNQPAERRRLVSELRQLLDDYPIAEVEFTQPIEHLLDELVPRLPNEHNVRALFIYGVELSISVRRDSQSTKHTDREFSPLVANLNVSRNSLPRHIPYPIILWLPAFAITAIMRGAPDFFSWRSALFQFPSPPEILAQLSQEALTGADAIATFNLTLEEKKERIAAIEDLLAEYESLPPDRRDCRVEGKLIYRLAALHYSVGDYGKARDLYHQSMEIGGALDYKDMVAASLHQLGVIAQQQGNYEDAERYHQQCLNIFKELGDQLNIAGSLQQLGRIAQNRGYYEEAGRYYQQSLNGFRQLRNKYGVAISLHNLGVNAQEQGDYEEAERCYRQSLRIKEELGDKSGIAASLHNLGMIAQERGSYEEAERYYRRGIEIEEEIGDKPNIAISLHSLGVMAQTRGNYEEAEHYYRQSLEIKEEIGDRLGIAASLYQLGRIAQLQREYEKAAQRIASALTIFERINSPYSQRAQENLTQLRGKIGEDRFESLLKDAQADPQRVVRDALESEEG
jgi:tetratricopeptide (TPR) repeat protein